LSYFAFHSYAIAQFFGKPYLSPTFKALLATLLSYILFFLFISMLSFFYGFYLALTGDVSLN